ncbi:MAG: MBL fold metallo-hydrolase, partial [Acidobacteriota bacterium]
MRITFLGTGTSRGVPLIGCDCKVCTSSNPKNKRLRPSILIESQANVVIDTSVDFRAQMLRHKVQQLDAIVYTHPHVDHILGLDDVYPFNFWSGKSLPIYGSPQTLKEVRITFRYLFEEERYPGTAEVELIPIEGTFPIGDLELQPIQVLH